MPEWSIYVLLYIHILFSSQYISVLVCLTYFCYNSWMYENLDLFYKWISSKIIQGSDQKKTFVFIKLLCQIYVQTILLTTVYWIQDLLNRLRLSAVYINLIMQYICIYWLQNVQLLLFHSILYVFTLIRLSVNN